MATTKAAGPISADRLKSFIERIEKLEEERKAIGGDIRDVYAEAKGVGYDVGTMRKVVRLRAMDAADRAEQETLLDVYWHALQTVDRIDARLAAGESQRDVAAAEGVSKTTVQRRGPKVESAPASSEMDHHKLEDGDDGITDAAGRFPGKQGDENAHLNVRVPEADRGSDREDGARASGGEGVQRRAGRGTAGGAGQDLHDPGASVERDVGERGDHAPAGRDAAPAAVEAPGALDLAHNEVQPSATPSVGAVASESERVASSSDDADLTIPPHLRGPSPANRRVA